MTEAEWLICSDPGALLAWLRGDDGLLESERKVLPERKSRLFCVASCCRVWQFLTDTRSRRAVQVTERYADGLASASGLQTAYDEAFDVSAELAELVDPRTGYFESIGRAANAAAGACHLHEYAEGVTGESLTAARAGGLAGENTIQAALVRCIFGNPFRPVSFDPVWRTSDVVALAKGIYEERAFDRMPILADALQDAGCTNDDILNHCRDTGTPHARGCWVVDLVLGKS